MKRIIHRALVRATERDTRLIMRSLRNTERVLHNGLVDETLAIEAQGNARIEDIMTEAEAIMRERFGAMLD